jgi:hypothetical protein
VTQPRRHATNFIVCQSTKMGLHNSVAGSWRHLELRSVHTGQRCPDKRGKDAVPGSQLAAAAARKGNPMNLKQILNDQSEERVKMIHIQR